MVCKKIKICSLFWKQKINSFKICNYKFFTRKSLWLFIVNFYINTVYEKFECFWVKSFLNTKQNFNFVLFNDFILDICTETIKIFSDKILKLLFQASFQDCFNKKTVWMKILKTKLFQSLKTFWLKIKRISEIMSL